MGSPFFKNRRLPALILAAAVLVVFGRMVSFDFVFYDDQAYVVANAHIRAGLTADSLRWALTALEAGFWQPLTWISLLLDREIWGMNPGGYHLTNLLLHLASVLLLFAALDRLTGETAKSFLVAALFAVHPLHVEPVAWIAARKDVLAGVFWSFALLLWGAYGEKEGKGSYLAVLGAYVLGLASKAMVVTLPAVLLLLDVWPLGRLGRRGWKRLVLEKAPFLIVGLAVGLATVAAEEQAGALKGLGEYPLAARLGNAACALAFYLGKTLLPFDLAVPYPHPGHWPLPYVAVSLAVVLILTYGALRNYRRRPYLLVGWLWYLVTLLPVTGLVQIGSHAFADRYSYLPLTGIFIAVVWGGASLGERREGVERTPEAEGTTGAYDDLSWERTGVGRCVAASLKADGPPVAPGTLAVAAAGAMVLFAVLSFVQTGYWRDAETLFRHAVEVTQDNWVARNNLGAALSRRGRPAEAVPHLAEALRLRPAYADALFNMGVALAQQGLFDEARRYYEGALSLRPDWPEAHNNLGIALAEGGDPAAAVGRFQEALRLDPTYGAARRNLETALKELEAKRGAKTPKGD